MKTLRKPARPARYNGIRRRIVAEAKGRFSDLTREAMKIEGQLVAEAKTRGVELLEGAQEKGQNALKGSAKWISSNPGAAVGAAFGVGFLFRTFFGRNRE